MARILIVDDEENIRNSLKAALERRGHEIVTAESFTQGAEFAPSGFDLIFLDVLLPDGNGLDLLKSILAQNRRQIVVVISGHADIDMAVEAIRVGAYDFIEKPVALDRVLITIDNATKTSDLVTENTRLSSLLYGEFVGDSPDIRTLKNDVVKSAPKATNFMILGENGTGKELIAHMTHRASRFADGPFVAVNCAALPSELIESELFGHTAGAFTGARSSRKGCFREAASGSIFLDEISEMPLAAQAKILRVVETRTIVPVGSDKPHSIECNIIVASNRDLAQMVSEGRFRQDLLYRLNVVQFHIPPLRDRTEDIPLLVTHFLRRFAAEIKTAPKTVSEDAISFLTGCDFPGNTRELKNLMERVNIYCESEVVELSDLKPLMPRTNAPTTTTLKKAMADFERDYIQAALSRNEGSFTKAARELGIERSHLYKKMKKHA